MMELTPSNIIQHVKPNHVLSVTLSVAIMMMVKTKEETASKSVVSRCLFRIKVALLRTIRFIDKVVANHQQLFLQISSFVNTIMTLILLAAGCQSVLFGQELTQYAATTAGSIIHFLWTTSSLVLAITLAIMSRSADSSVRDWTVGYALMGTCVVALADWMTPTPATPVFGLLLRDPVMSRGAFSKIAGVASLANMKNMYGGTALMANRSSTNKDNKSSKSNSSFLSKCIYYYAYVWPNVAGFVWTGYISWSCGVRYGYEGYMNYLASEDVTIATSVSPEVIVYFIFVLSTQCTLYAALLGNWRTHHKISRGMELGGQIILSIIATVVNGYAIWSGLYPIPLPKSWLSGA